MIKAASVSVGLAVFLATATFTWAQTVPTDDAVQEAVRRQADTLVLRQKLADAQDALARNDVAGAARLFQSAEELVTQIGSENVAGEAADAKTGLVDTNMKLAHDAEAAGDFKGAITRVDVILKADPTNDQAKTYKKSLEDKVESLKGKIPDDTTKDRGTGDQE